MTVAAPAIHSPSQHAAFEAKALALGLNPADPWIGGYVDYEWAHLRHIVKALPVAITGLQVLEVGCNVGASSVVFSQLGADVTAFDISPDFVQLARLNALRYGRDDITFEWIADSRQLPFADGRFDLISCNSVMEYVAADHQKAVMAEISRVLAPGGLVLLTGTSNRLWPKEVHSRKWLTNYLPRTFDDAFGYTFQRGLTPWSVRRGFGDGFVNLDIPTYDGFFARSRSAMGMSGGKLQGLLMAARLLRTGPGFLTPSMSCLLQKR